MKRLKLSEELELCRMLVHDASTSRRFFSSFKSVSRSRLYLKLTRFVILFLATFLAVWCLLPLGEPLDLGKSMTNTGSPKEFHFQWINAFVRELSQHFYSKVCPSPIPDPYLVRKLLF